MNPDFRHAMAVSSRWTMTPSVERRGIEPRLPGCKPSVFPLDQRPVVYKRSVRELNPVSGTDRQDVGWSATTAACCRNTYRPILFPATAFALHPRKLGGLSCFPAGIEPALSCMSGRRLRHWTTGSLMTEVGVEPTKSPRSQRDRFACLRTRPWRVRGSHPASEAYETSLSTGPPASYRSRYRAGLTGLMKASWAPAASAMPTCCRVAKARVELACPMDTTF